MANTFVSIPVPSANGAGAAVDMTTFGAVKTCVFSKGTANADISITLEFSNDAGGLFWAPLITEQGSGTLVTEIAARWFRAVVSNYKFGNPADVQVGGSDDGTTFATLTVPATDGLGPAVDISGLGLFKTIQIGDRFRGNVSVEFSEDGVTYGEFASFSNPGYHNALAVARFARVRRNGVPQVAPGTPVCNIGATFPPGGGPDQGHPQRFQYTVTGLEPDLSELTIPLPAARLNNAYLIQMSMEQATSIVGMAVDTASKTTTQFVLSLTGPATAGDIITFFVQDPT